MIELRGTREAINNLRRKPEEAKRLLARALFEVGSEAMLKSKRDYVPIDLGRLAGSGFVDLPEIRGNTITVTLGYDTEYAAAVHEYPTRFQPPSWIGKSIEFKPEGRGPKYLEKPVEEIDLDREVAARLRRL